MTRLSAHRLLLPGPPALHEDRASTPFGSDYWTRKRYHARTPAMQSAMLLAVRSQETGLAGLHEGLVRAVPRRKMLRLLGGAAHVISQGSP